MNSVIRHIRIIALAAIVAVVVAAPAPASAMNPVDSLKLELLKVKTAADSVPVLFNLYDASHYTQRGPILKTLYQTARRAGNEQAMADAVFLLSSVYEDEPSKEEEILKMADAIQDIDLHRRKVLYVNVRFATHEIRGLSEEERRTRLIDDLSRYKDHMKLDNYGRIEYLMNMCAYLRNVTDSELLISYLLELRELIESLPEDELALRALFYTQAAVCFYNNGLHEEAVDANKKMLEVNSKFDKLHESQGRIFRNYYGSTYFCYLNMLMCHDVLTDEEIDSYYERMLDISSRGDRLKASPKLLEQSLISYLMAKKRYSEALPLIKARIDNEDDESLYGYFVKAYVKAARETHNDEELLEALQLGNALLRQRLESDADLSLQELQTIYEINNLRTENRGLEQQKHLMSVEHRRRLADWIIIGATLVVLSIIWLLIMYGRSRQLMKKLYVSHRKFLKERNALKAAQADLIKARDKAKDADMIKNDFVNNMSDELRNPLAAIVEYTHLITDYASEDERSYINEYSEKLDLNTDMLVTLVNDVLDLPSMENGELSVRLSPVSVHEVCSYAIDSVEKHLSPDVKLVFLNADDEDVKIVTDSNKVEQILIHMLVNAAKFTPEGTIDFGYEFNSDRTKITFTVTDTGIGIPRGQEEAIFERFHKVDPTTQGNGLGLYIGRMLVELLNGTLIIDKEYRSGARFSLTVPTV